MSAVTFWCPLFLKISRSLTFRNAYQGSGRGKVIDKRGGTINGQPRLSIMRGCSRSCLHFEYSFIYLQSKQFIFFLYPPPPACLPFCLFALQMFIDMAFCLTVCLSVCLISQRGANKATNEPLTLAIAH